MAISRFCPRLTLKTIKKAILTTYTANYNEYVTKVNQQQQCGNEGDRQANAIISNVNKIHKQQYNSDRVLEKARTQTFYHKNVRQTVYVGLKTRQWRQRVVVI